MFHSSNQTLHYLEFMMLIIHFETECKQSENRTISSLTHLLPSLSSRFTFKLRSFVLRNAAIKFSKLISYVFNLYTKSHFWAFFGPTCMYKKLRTFNFGTVPPGVTTVVSTCAGNSKENSHKVSWRELCALQSNHAKCRGGAIMPPPPPPPVFLRLKAMWGKFHEVHLGMVISWQLRGLCGNYRMYTCGMYVATF